MASHTSITALRAARMSQLLGSARAFSTSSSLGVRAVFGEVSNERLAKHLDRIQRTITLPAHLPANQRKIVFDPTKKQFLEQNPIDLEIEGLEHRFTAINPMKDIPNSEQAFKYATKLMTTAEDWANFEILLAGFKKSGRRLRPAELYRAAGLAVNSGYTNEVIRAARHAEETGLYLTDRLMHRIILGIAEKANEDPVTASKWLDDILDIIARQPHNKYKTTWKPTYTKLVTGTALYVRMVAVAAQEAGSVKQRDLDALADEAVRVGSMWKSHFNDGADGQQADIEQNVWPSPDGRGLNHPTMAASHITCLFAYSIKALETVPSLVQQDAELFDKAANLLKERLGPKLPQDNPRLPFYASMYRKIVGEAPSWSEPAPEGAELPMNNEPPPIGHS